MGPEATVIFATCDRPETLSRMMPTLLAQWEEPGADFNAIVIDTGVNDQSAGILKEACGVTQFLHVINLPGAGKNKALNCALDSGLPIGALVILTDDDVLFPQSFVQRYLELSREHPSVHLFGGLVDADWPVNPDPRMLAGINHVVAFALTPEDMRERSGMVPAVRLHGPNMAVRRTVFDAGINFDEKIGPDGNSYVMGGESEFLYRAGAHFGDAFFDVELTVGHIIRPEQLEVSWIVARAHKAGRSLLMHQRHRGERVECKTLGGYPRWALKKLLSHRIQLMRSRRGGEPWYQALWDLHHLRGYCEQFRAIQAVTPPSLAEQ